ncbi:MAG: hypothetical protein C0467_17270 [Planctomycetaceae bacterium]|nr:hypothetical protein [Planctomycetaceae bacterium]
MSATPIGSSDDKNRYGRQIEEAFEAAAKLAGSNLAPTDFYEQFLNRALAAIEAPAGAVWLRTPQGFLQVACQLNLDKIGLDAKRGGRQCHNEVLRQVFQAAPPRPVILEPNGRLAPGPGESGPVPPANLTDHFALFAPIVTADKQSLGVLEVFQNPSHDPRMYPAFLNYAFQMAGYASQYHQFISARTGSSTERTFVQIEAFSRLVHTTLNPTEVAYHIANEGRKIIECDRLCVGVRYARKKVTVEAVSGADVVEKASTHVRRMRLMMEAVLQWGEPLVFKGTKDPGLPPAVAESLDEYLHESQPKLLVVQPIRDEREKDATKPARSVLLLESFNPPENSEPLVQRLDVIAKHSAPALYNAAELKRVPLKFLWWPLAKLQEGVGGKAKFIGITVALLIVFLIAAMVLVPYPLRMEAKGQLLPVEVAQIFPPRPGVVREIRAKPGDKISPGFEVVSLYDPELGTRYGEAQDKFTLSVRTVELLTRQIDDPNISPAEKVPYRKELVTAENERDSSKAVIEALDRQYNGGRPSFRPGWFRAFAPDFDPKLGRPVGASHWTVLSDDRRESLLGKTVKPEQELLRVGNLQGPWQIELKIPQRSIGQILRAFADPAYCKTEAGSGKRYLDVDVLLSSQPDASYLGRLYRDDVSAQAVPNKTEHDETEPVITAYVKLNLDSFPEALKIPTDQFVTGMEVRTRIRCGEHALGYSMFHGVWEWFYEKVVFFF